MEECIKATLSTLTSAFHDERHYSEHHSALSLMVSSSHIGELCSRLFHSLHPDSSSIDSQSVCTTWT